MLGGLIEQLPRRFLAHDCEANALKPLSAHLTPPSEVCQWEHALPVSTNIPRGTHLHPFSRKVAASSPLSEWRVRVQVYPLESQTVSLHPECRALIISKYQACILSLAYRILSDPCESVSVMTFNGGAPTRNVNLLVSYLLLFVSRPSVLLPLCPGANIIPTLFSLGSSEDLGENVEKGRFVWQRSAS